MKLTFVEMENYGGMDWHDCSTTTKMLREKGSYAVTNPLACIAEDIHETLSNLRIDYSNQNSIRLESVPSVSEILKYLEDGSGFYLHNETEDSVFYQLEASWIPNEMALDLQLDQCSYKQTYTIRHIDEANVRYFVTENFHAISKGIPTIERFYSRPVTDLTEAQKLYNEIPLHSELSLYGSDKELIVFDISCIAESAWYKTNMQIIALLEQIPDVDKLALFRANVFDHLHAISEYLGIQDLDTITSDEDDELNYDQFLDDELPFN